MGDFAHVAYSAGNLESECYVHELNEKDEIFNSKV